MSWLHCMWGVGATVGPFLISHALLSGAGWQMGYRYVFYIQAVLAIFLFLSLPLWKKAPNLKYKNTGSAADNEVLNLKQILRVPGAKEIMVTFFCYCAIEQTTGLWATSYLVQNEGLGAQEAASFAGLFFLGVTIGRALSGFITFKLNDKQMIRYGTLIIAIGIILIMAPLSSIFAFSGLIIVGLGCAPIYPCIIHSTPENFGSDKSQAIIGVQMASAYIGSCLMPSFFGFMTKYLSISFLPIYLTVLLILLIITYNMMLKKTLFIK